MRRLLRAVPIVALTTAALAAPASASAAFKPGINAVSPLAASPVAGGTTYRVTVFGSLDASAQLWFGDTPGTEQTARKNSVICLPAVGVPCDTSADVGWTVSAKAPAHAAGKVDLSVRYGDQVLSGQTEESDDFVFYEEPRIVSVTAASGPIAGGNTVKINLAGLLIKDPTVKFGETAATVLDSVQTGGGPGSATQTITVTAPPGPADTVVDVSVTGIVDRGVPQSATAVGATARADDYGYAGFGDIFPRITRVTGVAYAWVGGIATIQGVRFGNLKSVTVGSRQAFVLSKSSTQIIILAPPLAAKSYPVTVTTADGAYTAATTLTYRSLG